MRAKSWRACLTSFLFALEHDDGGVRSLIRSERGGPFLFARRDREPVPFQKVDAKVDFAQAFSVRRLGELHVDRLRVLGRIERIAEPEVGAGRCLVAEKMDRVAFER